MRVKSELFTVNGKPLFNPDEDMEVSFEDLDSADSGRSETGEMFRIVVRYKLGKWSFEYDGISLAEYTEQERLFPNAPSFTFGHPGRIDPTVQEFSTCYRSKYGISYMSLVNEGQIKNYKFNIIEC